MKIVKSMFNIDLADASKYICPVLLRVQPDSKEKGNDDDDDDDSSDDGQFDLDIVKHQLHEILMNDVKNQELKANSLQDVKIEEQDQNEESAKQVDQGKDHQNNSKHDNIHQLKQFYTEFASKLQVYDPLERPIPNKKKDQAIKRDQLLDLMLQTKMVSHKKVEMPMTNSIHIFLNQMFDSIKKENANIAKTYLNKKQTKPDKVQPTDFNDNPALEQSMQIFKFFKENGLGADSDKRLKEFENWKREILKLGDCYTNFKNLSE